MIKLIEMKKEQIYQINKYFFCFPNYLRNSYFIYMTVELFSSYHNIWELVPEGNMHIHEIIIDNYIAFRAQRLMECHSTNLFSDPVTVSKGSWLTSIFILVPIMYAIGTDVMNCSEKTCILFVSIVWFDI